MLIEVSLMKYVVFSCVYKKGVSAEYQAAEYQSRVSGRVSGHP